MSGLTWNGKKVERKLARKAETIVPCITKTIAKKARQLVPVKTGALRKSIKATENSVTAGSDKVDYAGIVELGTARRAAQPFLRPAIEQFSKNDLKKCIT